MCSMFNKQEQEGLEILLSFFTEEEKKKFNERNQIAEQSFLKTKEEKRQEKLRQKRLRENELVNCEHCNCRITRKNLRRHQLTDNCRIHSNSEREWKNKEKMYLDKIKELEDKIKEYEK